MIKDKRREINPIISNFIPMLNNLLGVITNLSLNFLALKLLTIQFKIFSIMVIEENSAVFLLVIGVCYCVNV